MKREIIEIDNEKCNGCGLCVPNCHEGALQIIDGKARLISDLFCDGLGACLGHCPQGAITVVQREAEPYDERKTMEQNIVPAGKATIAAHLQHMLDHKQQQYYEEAVAYLKEVGVENPLESEKVQIQPPSGGCPGSRIRVGSAPRPESSFSGKAPSRLNQWPIQLHLVSPQAPYYQKADLLIAADCTAFTVGHFHESFLKDKALAIACPKLDQGREIYLEKLKAMVELAKVNTVTVMIMEVPCCGSLLALVKEALSQTSRKVPLKKVVVSLEGEILEEDWV